MKHGTVASRGLGIKWLQQHQCFSTRQHCRAPWGWHSTTSGASADVGTQSSSASSITGTKSIALAENVRMCRQREETWGCLAGAEKDSIHEQSEILRRPLEITGCWRFWNWRRGKSQKSSIYYYRQHLFKLKLMWPDKVTTVLLCTVENL